MGTTTAVPVPGPVLLLDNERLREAMREREQGAPPAGMPLVVRAVLKPAAIARLAGPALPARPGRWPQHDWPDALRQLHWELGASTHLRPLARALQKAAVLPDPFVVQGGLWCDQAPEGLQYEQHPRTGLYPVIRFDLLLAGAVTVQVDGQAVALQAGDALAVEAGVPVSYGPAAGCAGWSAYYYAPDPCCCQAPGGVRRNFHRDLRESSGQEVPDSG